MILEAIDRASDLTLRGVRGVIAEAAFVTYILPKLKGWTSLEVEGDQSFDFLLADGQAEPVRVQVKLQRQQRQQPMRSEQAPRRLGYPPGPFIVETQRTRTGKGRQGENTRPYRFGEFDILAVSLHPSTNDWSRFVYTVANWLIPRSGDEDLIAVYQPVSPMLNGRWTDDLEEAIRWFRSGRRQRIL